MRNLVNPMTIRDLIFASLHRRMAADKRLYFLTADVGWGTFDKIAKDFPDRFLNVGIAEQTMIGMAAGLATSGYLPVCYSHGNFITHRCFEQLRDDITLNDLPIVLMAGNLGFDIHQSGPSHHAVDDWGVLRNLPGWTVHCPISRDYAGYLLKVFEGLIGLPKRLYIRIPKGNGIAAPDDPSGLCIRGEGETVVLSYGALGQSYFEAAEPKTKIVLLNRIHPLSADAIIDAIDGGKRVIVAEDHFADTGLYASVCQLAVKRRLTVPIEPWAPRQYHHRAGADAASHWRHAGINAETVFAPTLD